MLPEARCPNCNKPLAGDRPRGLCPECLFRAAAGNTLVDPARTAPHSSSSEAIAPEAGVRLKYFGDYELLHEIARGGMGVVWKARQTSLNRVVALKMIRTGALAGAEEVKRFRREAEAAANLQHPNIVAIHEVGEHGGQHYFTMDYVAGSDLSALVKDGPLVPRVAAEHVRTVSEAIHFAHQRGTLHRDLKPQNVLIDEAGRPRVTDFGLAKMMGEEASLLTQSGVAMGSPSYMPPEQAAGWLDEVGPASDVYSLGAMLYELLTGRPPFRAATALATLRDVLDREPISPRSLNPALPRDLETICLKCLRKQPGARYPTARALAEELDRFLKGEPIQARPAGPMRRLANWSRRRPGIWAALATLLLVTVGFGAYYLFEENAFLRAKQVDPSLVRAAGSRQAAVEAWNTANSFAIMAGIYLILWLRAKAQGISLRQMFDPQQFNRPMKPLSERLQALAAVAGVLILGCGTVLLVKTIQANVWEGTPIWGSVLTIYGAAFFGMAGVHLAVQSRLQTQYGQPRRQLTAEQVESIRQAMEGFDVTAAVRRYREAVPDAGLAEARDYSLALAESLRDKHPGKYELPPLSLTAVNWGHVLICLALEAVVGGVVWAVAAPADPVTFMSEATYAFLFAIGIVAGFRVRGFVKRMLMLIPALVALAIGKALGAESSDSLWLSYAVGGVFGLALAIAALTPRRK